MVRRLAKWPPFKFSANQPASSITDGGRIATGFLNYPSPREQEFARHSTRFQVLRVVDALLIQDMHIASQVHAVLGDTSLRRWYE